MMHSCDKLLQVKYFALSRENSPCETLVSLFIPISLVSLMTVAQGCPKGRHIFD